MRYIQLVLFVLAVLALGQVGHSQGSNRITFEACCTQGIIDQDHAVTLRLEKEGQSPVTITRPAYETSSPEDIAAGFAFELTTMGIASVSEENMFDKEADRAEDLVLPSDWKVKSIKIEKGGQGDDGHLKATSRVQGVVQQLPVPRPPGILATGGITEFDIELYDFSNENIRYEIVVRGWDPNGRMVHANVSSVFLGSAPNGFTLAYKLSPVGTFLSGLGMTVSYPASGKLHVLIPKNMAVSEVAFMATNDYEVDDQRYDIEFGLEAN